MLQSLQRAVRMVREDPTVAPSVLRKGIRRLSGAGRMTVSSHVDWGSNVYEEDWDLLIILDTCRVDALKHFRDEFYFLRDGQFETRTSLGGATLEWLSKTFTSRTRSGVSKTAYLSGNGWTELIFERGARPEDHLNVPWTPTTWNTVDISSFAYFDNVWRRAEGTNPISDFPRPDSDFITDAAIRLGRREEFERTIVHFMQPHSPYVENALAAGRDTLQQYESDPFEYLCGGGSRDTAWNAYLTELETALRSVETLLRNFDAQDVIISADHGEAFGEWGVYGHLSGSIHPKVRKVPWIRTTATDRRTHNPKEQGQRTVSENQLERQLEALGYM